MGGEFLPTKKQIMDSVIRIKPNQGNHGHRHNIGTSCSIMIVIVTAEVPINMTPHDDELDLQFDLRSFFEIFLPFFVLQLGLSSPPATLPFFFC